MGQSRKLLYGNISRVRIPFFPFRDVFCMNKLVFYTDGACSGNPGEGSFGIVGLKNDIEFMQFSQYESFTTSNRMEMKAVIWVLKTYHLQTFNIFSDSQYVVNGLKIWSKNWVKNNWQTTKGPVLNIDLWKEMLYYFNEHYVNIQWVKGHGDNIHNIKVDKLVKNTILLKVGKKNEF